MDLGDRRGPFWFPYLAAVKQAPGLAVGIDETLQIEQREPRAEGHDLLVGEISSRVIMPVAMSRSENA